MNKKLFDVVRKVAKVDKALARELLTTATRVPTDNETFLTEETAKSFSKDLIETAVWNLGYLLNRHPDPLLDEADEIDIANAIVALTIEKRLNNYRENTGFEKTKVYKLLKNDVLRDKMFKD